MEIPEDIERELERRGGIAKLLDRLREKEIEDSCRLYKALSSDLRLKILSLLGEQDLCVCLLKDILGIQDSKLSYHLSILKDQGLIEGKRDANFMIYRITEKGKKFVP